MELLLESLRIGGDELIDLQKKIPQITPYIIEIRRELHQYPETKFNERKTGTIIKRELTKMGLDYCTIVETGVMGIIEGTKKGKTIALRADMDALPVQEETSVSYHSQHPGFMHACGHDAHMAMLLGATQLLIPIKDQLKGRVLVIFQPGEEGGAGAKKVVAEGHLDDVQAIFGAHVWPTIPPGTIATVAGPMMASSDAFKIKVKGKGGHSALPHTALDPMPVCIDIYNGLYKYLTRQIPVDEPVVLTIPKIEASNAYNLIPHEVMMEGTLRTFDLKIRDEIENRIHLLAKEYARGWGLECEVEFFRPTFPPLINDQGLVDLIYKGALELEIPIKEAKKSMVSEDFPFYLEKCPGGFFFLGIKTTEGFPLHHPQFNIEGEEVLGLGGGLLAHLAYLLLGEGS